MLTQNELASLLDLTLPFAAWLGFAENGVKAQHSFSQFINPIRGSTATLTRGSLTSCRPIDHILLVCLQAE